MAQVVFLTGVADKAALALRLIHKKLREGGRVCVLGPAQDLRALDQALWSAEPLSFIPHLWVRGEAPSGERQRLTPVWLTERPTEGLDCDSVINLGADEPSWLARFARVAEIVGPGDDERRAGRQRWKAYEAAGHALTHHAG